MNMDRLSSEIAVLLAGMPEIRLALIFGSTAHGRAHGGSDIDVAVAAGGRLDAVAKARLIEQLAGLSGRAVDLVDLHTAHGLLLAQVLTDGRLLVCRDHALYAQLIQRMLRDREDMLPYQRRIQAVRRDAWIGR